MGVRAGWIVALAVPWAGCTAPLAERGADDARKASPAAVVATARPVPVPAGEGFPSNLYVEHDVVLGARITGIVEQVLVDRGDRVKAGQALSVIDTDVAEQELEIARQNERLADAEFKRIEPLHEQSVVSAQDYLQARIDLDQARSKVKLASAMLDRYTTRAPFDGIVVERWAVRGQRVLEDEGTPLFRVIANEPLRARVNVPEKLLSSLKPGGSALVKCLDEDTPHPARVVFVGPAIDPGSGTAPVIIETKHRGGSMRAGSSVEIRFGDESASPAYQVPREAVVGDGEDALVRIVSDGRAVSRRVRVLATRGDQAVVEGPLHPDDDVIVSGESVTEGASVIAAESSR